MDIECSINLYNQKGGSAGTIEVETTSDVLHCSDIYLGIISYLNETISYTQLLLELDNKQAEALGKALLSAVSKRQKYIDDWTESMKQEGLEEYESSLKKKRKK